MAEYQRYLTSSTEPFDPVLLAHETEKIVGRDGARKYTAFYATGVYGGIATGYTVGCCLRCYYCWVDWSRDFPEKYGEFYTAEEAFRELCAAAKKFGVKKMRISGAEPTLCKEHLLGLLEKVDSTDISVFILETNGILFGADKNYVHKLSAFKKPHIRLSLKAALPEGFQMRTGAKKEFYNLPFQGIKNLLDEGVSFHVAAMTDPRVMSAEERKVLIERLYEIDIRLALRLEEEIVDPYDTTLARLKLAGIELDWKKYLRKF